MTDPSTKQLLTDVIRLQQTQIEDITKIKLCLLGDEFHPEGGMVNNVKQNGDCIKSILTKKIPDLEIRTEVRVNNIEKAMERRSGVVGSMVALGITAVTTFFNYIIFRR